LFERLSNYKAKSLTSQADLTGLEMSAGTALGLKLKAGRGIVGSYALGCLEIAQQWLRTLRQEKLIAIQ
jgi:hypothetical protein